jgi:hypothetical protein
MYIQNSVAWYWASEYSSNILDLYMEGTQLKPKLAYPMSELGF